MGKRNQMNGQKSDAEPRDSTARPGTKPYESPELTEVGTILQLTNGGTLSGPDGAFFGRS